MRKYAIILLFICFAGSVRASRIVYPGKACPAIAQAGKTIEILYYNPNRGPAREIDSVILRGPYNRIGLRVEQVENGKFVYDSFTRQYATHRITATVPEETPEELFDLIVKVKTSVCVTPKAVKIVREFRKKHKFIHISDPHVSRQWVQTEHGNYAKELELLDKFIPLANLIAPDFIMVTGDLVHDVTRMDADSTGYTGYLIMNKADESPLFDEMLVNYFQGAMGFSGVWGFDAPVFSTTGNHDFYGMVNHDYLGKCRQWNKALGKRIYGFSYAGTRVIVSDDFLGDTIRDRPTATPMAGLQGEMIRDFFAREGQGDLIVWGKHHYGRIDSAFMNDHKVRIILHGHNHSPREQWIGDTPTLNIRSGTVCRSGNAHIWKQTLGFFRVFTIDGDRFEYSEPLRFCSNPTAAYDELLLNLTLDFAAPNDGSSTHNEAIVRNRFDTGFEECRIRFVMPRGDYEVSTGRIDQRIDSGGVTVLDVRFDIPPRSETSVRIDDTRNSRSENREK